MSEPKFYTDTDLCERWRCSAMTLWRWRQKGILGAPINPGGGKNLTSEEAVKEFEETCRKDADAA